MDAAQAGRLLAERHRAHPTEPAVDGSLANYAEAPRSDDWTLRSAMTRLAQPEPALVDTIAVLMRRLDAVLGPITKPLEKNAVVADRGLDADALEQAPVRPYPDLRIADLARLMAESDDEAGAVLDAYQADEPLGPEETAALPLLRVALDFDALAEALVAWALTAPSPAPAELITRTCASVQQQLDDLGVPVEQGPPPRGGRRRG